VTDQQHVQFLFNTQHDCATAKCTASKRTPRRQERLDLDETEPVIEHQPLEVYVVNTHSLHNSHLLRRALPRDLIAPLPFIGPDQRQAEHAKLVAKWRENPKSQTAQGQAREKRRAEEATKKKKGKRGKGHLGDGTFKGPLPKEEVKEEMKLISELSTPPPFLAGIRNDTEGGCQE
jgi:hypothetical protein